MTTPAKPEEASFDQDEAGRRRRGDNLVEEARIIAAGGGIAGLNRYFQAFVYLVILTAVGITVWWALRE